MNKLIPVLPCSDADTLVEFYKHLGFELVGKFTRSYLVLNYNELELSFYGTKQVPPEANSSMCVIHTDDLEQLYNAFTAGLKANTGKIPRNGLPKISKIRDLNEDRRFTLTDPSGNTFYVVTPKQDGSNTFLRDLDNVQYAEKFMVLYDLVYSKEDCKVANNLLPKLLGIKEQLGDLDKAKLLLVALEIQMVLQIPSDAAELKSLIAANHTGDEWKRIEERYIELNRQD